MKKSEKHKESFAKRGRKQKLALSFMLQRKEIAPLGAYLTIRTQPEERGKEKREENKITNLRQQKKEHRLEFCLMPMPGGKTFRKHRSEQGKRKRGEKKKEERILLILSFKKKRGQAQIESPVTEGRKWEGA